MLIVLQLIKAWQTMGLELAELKMMLGNIEDLDDATEFLVELVDAPTDFQAERLLRVIENGSYQSAFALANMKGSPISAR